MMIGIYLLIVAANAVIANDEVKPDYCIDYHPQCPVDQTANSTATHLPVYQDCHKFYKCDYGRACVFSCPTYNGGTRQLVFNPKLQVCDYPWNVPGLPNCEDTPSTNSTTTVPPPTDTPPDTPTTTPTTTTPGGSIPAECLKGCPVSGRARVRHPTSCNYYYDCVDGKYVLRKCLENLYFNCYVQACDRPQNLPPNYPCSDLNLGE